MIFMQVLKKLNQNIKNKLLIKPSFCSMEIHIFIYHLFELKKKDSEFVIQCAFTLGSSKFYNQG